MSKPKTTESPIPEWRSFLGTLIRTPQERQRIAGALGVNPMTMQRWASNTNTPRPSRLLKLIALFPEHRTHLLSLISEEFPQISFL